MKEHKELLVEGKLVFLKEICESDFEDIIRWRNDPENNRYLNQNFELTMALQEDWYRTKYLPSSDILFIFIDRKNKKRFGMIGLNDLNEDTEIGIAGRLLIGEKNYRSSPEMLEANLCFYDFLFHTLKLKQTYCHIVKENKKAIALDKKLGFKVNEGRIMFPEYLNVNGMEQTEMIMTRETFEEARLNLKPMMDHYTEGKVE